MIRSRHSLRPVFAALSAALLSLALALPAPAACLRVHAAPASMTAIDGGDGNQDKNLSSDPTSKVLVNYADGEVTSKGATAVLLTLPESLFSADPADLARATLSFGVSKARNWDPAVFTPGRDPLATPYSFAGATWNNASAATPWTTPGGDTLDVPPAVGTFDATAQTLSFDLLPLLSSPEASAALAANGALVRLDSQALPDADSFVMLNLHNTQAADPALLPDAYFVVRTAASVNDPFPAASGVSRIYCIDAATPDATEWNAAVRFILNADPSKGDTRVLLALPDLDLPTVASLGTLRIQASPNWKGNPEIPAFANVLTVPFGATEATAATWNRADHSDPATAWDGGAFSGAPAFPAVFAPDSVSFDLSPLLASDLRGDAFANGLVLQWDVSQRAAVTNSHVRLILYRDNPAPALAWTQRPVTHSYIDSGKPAKNFGWSGANNDKCIVLLSPDGEARTLVKFAPSFFGFDPAQNPSLLLVFPYWKEWPAADPDAPNRIVLHPLASPFRMDQATWNSAAADTPWATPGGDLDESVSVPGRIDRDAQTIAFDMAPLFANPSALAELRENGAALRILGTPPEDGNAGFNFYSAGPPVALAVAADGVGIRSISFAPPADADSGAPTCTLSLTGLDPTLDYAVYSCTDLAAGDWSTFVAPVPDDGRVTFRPAAPAASYRVELRK